MLYLIYRLACTVSWVSPMHVYLGQLLMYLRPPPHGLSARPPEAVVPHFRTATGPGQNYVPNCRLRVPLLGTVSILTWVIPPRATSSPSSKSIRNHNPNPKPITLTITLTLFGRVSVGSDSDDSHTADRQCPIRFRSFPNYVVLSYILHSHKISFSCILF